MQRFLRHFRLSKKQTISLSILLFVAAVTALLVPSSASAVDNTNKGVTGTVFLDNAVADKIFQLLSYLVMSMIRLFALLTGFFVGLLVQVAQWNKFINVAPVQTGYTLVRDLANMMFIIGLLMIAAGTILRLENYRYNRLLGKLIVMAFLVNFALFIGGFFIQAAQVFMLTFVNAFRDIAFANFAYMFGLDSVLKFANSNTIPNGGFSSVFAGLVAGLAMMVISFVVMLAYTVTLLVRIVALWILLILSPIAYALRVLPNTEKYAAQWWSEFSKYVVIGPLITFFLWLALAISAAGTGQTSILTNVDNSFQEGNQQVFDQTQNINLEKELFTDIFTFDKFLTFLVAIIFLMLGLQYAQKTGGLMGDWAKGVAAKGFAGASAVTGLNWLRDRTVAPVQGYIASRGANRKEDIARRNAGFIATTDKITSNTVGQIGRVTAAGGRIVGQTRDQALGVAGEALRQGARLARRESTVQDFGREVGARIQQAPGSIAGAGLLGLKQGTDARQRALANAAKTKAAEAERQAKFMNVGKMSRAERRRVARSGTEAERHAAQLEMARKNEFVRDAQHPDFAGDRVAAQELGSSLLGAAGNARDFEKSLEGIEQSARNMMLGGRDYQHGYTDTQRDMLASVNFLHEAFGDNADAAQAFMERSESKVVDNFKKGLTSDATLGNEHILERMHGLDKMDAEAVTEGTKNSRMRDMYSQTMTNVVDRINATGDFTATNRPFTKLRQSLVIGARGGTTTDAAGNETGVIEHAYKNINTGQFVNADAEEAARRVIRTQGKHLSRYEHGHQGGFPSTDEFFDRNITTGALKAIFEKNPQMVVEAVNAIRGFAQNDPHHA